MDNSGNILYTNAVKMVEPISGEFAIVDEPVNFEGEVGEMAVFTVNATGVASYQWEYSANNGTSWGVTGVSGNKTASISVEITAARYKNLYRCKLMDNSGNELYTVAVKMVNPKIELDGVTYARLTDSELVVVSYTGTDATIVIPETIEGMTVTKIGEGAFEGNTTLQSITLPDTITIIGARAFKGCTSLREMK